MLEFDADYFVAGHFSSVATRADVEEGVEFLEVRRNARHLLPFAGNIRVVPCTTE